MDVNAIGNNITPIKGYSDNSNISQNANAIPEGNSEVQSDKKVGKGQENQSKQENKDGAYKKKLEKAVNKLNKFLEDDKTHAEYSVHKDLGTIMIKIIDDDTHQVILEVPSKKILRVIKIQMIKKMKW